jgi:phosphatidylglycerol:prolipoprotein diacylglycerol transferase
MRSLPARGHQERHVSFLFAEIAYPRIDPIVFQVGPLKVRWYGVSYILAFVAAFLVLTHLAKKRRWAVPPDRVWDVLFWGILGVFVGGRLGYVFLYAWSEGRFSWTEIHQVWKGGMSFHGGFLGVVLAYWIYTGRKGLARGDFFDALSLATAPGIFFVRMANFVNAELYGRPWDGPWAMSFPEYPTEAPERWDGTSWTEPRHPSQLYEGLTEGLLLFAVLWVLMLKRGWGGGRVSAAFLFLYGAFRFVMEFFREPDAGIGFDLFGVLTRGQLLCAGMMLAGVVVYARSDKTPRGEAAAA